MFTLRREIWEKNECVSQNIKVRTIADAYEHLKKEFDDLDQLVEEDGGSFGVKNRGPAVVVKYSDKIHPDREISYELINPDILDYVPLSCDKIKPDLLEKHGMEFKTREDDENSYDQEYGE